MLTAKEAVNAAQQWVTELYPTGELRHLRVEEIKLFDDEQRWEVTLGWVEPAIRENTFAASLSSDVKVLPRVYKTLDVDANTGEVKSMRIREVAA